MKLIMVVVVYNLVKLKEGLATIIAEWDAIEGLDIENSDKLTIKLIPELVLKYLDVLVMMILILWDLVVYFLDRNG